jgi:hypothetical protein
MLGFLHGLRVDLDTNPREQMMRMNKAIRIVLALSIASAVYAADVVVSAVHGTVEKVDSAS